MLVITSLEVLYSFLHIYMICAYYIYIYHIRSCDNSFIASFERDGLVKKGRCTPLHACHSPSPAPPPAAQRRPGCRTPPPRGPAEPPDPGSKPPWCAPLCSSAPPPPPPPEHCYRRILGHYRSPAAHFLLQCQFHTHLHYITYYNDSISCSLY